jgi:hypothetical protein
MRMRPIIIFLIAVLLGTPLQATSYHFSLPEKVKACRAILRVTITETQPPPTGSLNVPAIFQAKVEDVLKGPKHMTKVEFRFIPYVDFDRLKLKKMIGQTYLVFLHELEGRYWVFEGLEGIRPISRKYQESRMRGGELVEESYDHQQFVSRIRSLARTK